MWQVSLVCSVFQQFLCYGSKKEKHQEERAVAYHADIRSMGDVSRFHARVRGDATALVFEGEAQSYHLRNERCSRIANGLIAEGVGPQMARV